jgi:hypothetical protein
MFEALYKRFAQCWITYGRKRPNRLHGHHRLAVPKTVGNHASGFTGTHAAEALNALALAPASRMLRDVQLSVEQTAPTEKLIEFPGIPLIRRTPASEGNLQDDGRGQRVRIPDTGWDLASDDCFPVFARPPGALVASCEVPPPPNTPAGDEQQNNSYNHRRHTGGPWQELNSERVKNGRHMRFRKLPARRPRPLVDNACGS